MAYHHGAHDDAVDARQRRVDQAVGACRGDGARAVVVGDGVAVADDGVVIYYHRVGTLRFGEETDVVEHHAVAVVEVSLEGHLVGVGGVGQGHRVALPVGDFLCVGSQQVPVGGGRGAVVDIEVVHVAAPVGLGVPESHFVGDVGAILVVAVLSLSQQQHRGYEPGHGPVPVGLQAQVVAARQGSRGMVVVVAS